MLTDTTGFVARPLVIVLACDGPLSHQLKGRLAEEGQHVTVLEAIAAAATKRWHPRIATASTVNFCNTHTHTQHRVFYVSN